MGASRILGRSQGHEVTKISMEIPKKLLENVHRISRRLNYSASDFMREGINEHIKKFK